MRVAVLGVGLIGGSVGLAARARCGAEVAGYSPSGASAKRGVELGALDRACPTVAEAVEGAGIVVCTAPVALLPASVREALDAAGEDCVVTDVGSVKSELAREFAGESRFVGGHPLAGAETAGVENAREDLLEGARWYLTPGPESSGMLYDRLQRFVSGLGARPQAIDADTHDRSVAAVSHMPHVVANVLANLGVEGTEALGALAPSLRDATRVAGSNPTLWAQIYGSNREALLSSIGSFIEGLQVAAAVIGSGDEARIAAWQAEASESRRALAATEVELGPTHEIRVMVPNRPGVLAELALALSKDGINISDMSLDPAPDMKNGAISLWVSGQGQADAAAECLARLGHPFTVLNQSEEA